MLKLVNGWWDLQGILSVPVMDSFRGSFHIASIRKHRTNRSHFHWRWHGIAASRWCVFDLFYCHPPCRSHGSAAPVKKIAAVVFVLGIPCKSWRIMAETLNDSKYTTNQKQWNGLGWIRHCSHESWQSVVFISCSCGKVMGIKRTASFIHSHSTTY